jgi:cleavage and polyadenylation specificity factor subunit 3
VLIVSDNAADDGGRLYDEADVQASWHSAIAVDYHQDIVISGGLRFTPYHAGHVLGASMFMIEIAGLKILYTGDYSREEDRHLVMAEVPPIKPDVMICESTFGVHTWPDRKEREEAFTGEQPCAELFVTIADFQPWSAISSVEEEDA